MTRLAIVTSATLLACSSAWAQTPVSSTTLKVGDSAPDFTLPSTAGKPVKLSDFKGKKNVVLAFFPAAFTGGCTKEMQAYQLGGTKFEANDTQVFGVSTDNTPSQKVFAQQLNLTFLLLSDFADRKVSQDYGVMMPGKGMDNRITFVIDKEGKISYMESGKTDTAGSDEACSRLAHRASN